MNKYLSKHLTPSQMSKLYIALVIIIGLGLSYAIMEMLSGEKKERKARPVTENIITNANTREFGLAAVNAKASTALKHNRELEEKIETIQAQNEEDESNSHSAKKLKNQVNQLLEDNEKLKIQLKKQEERFDKKIASAVSKALSEQEVEVRGTISKSDSSEVKTARLPINPERRSNRNTGFSYGNSNQSNTSNGNSSRNTNQGSRRNGDQTGPDNDHMSGRTGNLFAIIENVEQIQEDLKSAIYVPKGTILTGVLLTGLDAPTAAGASESPIPVLVRLKKEAILPNYAVIEEVRECFAIMAGYGNLSSERAFLRGESITCVRKDKTIVEAQFQAFAVGEDAKNGLKGTLVSRNSTLLANTMMAGFAQGLASMFDVNPVPVLSTSSDGTQQYQDVFSTDALQGGAAKGASQSMEKLADYYMNLANEVHPIIEIGAGRVIDMVVTEGATL